jgi:hypothetical protein
MESQSNKTDEVTSKTTSVETTVATETTTKSHTTLATETTRFRYYDKYHFGMLHSQIHHNLNLKKRKYEMRLNTSSIIYGYIQFEHKARVAQ